MIDTQRSEIKKRIALDENTTRVDLVGILRFCLFLFRGTTTTTVRGEVVGVGILRRDERRTTITVRGEGVGVSDGSESKRE